MLQPEGLVTHNGSGEWTYKYLKKDHLGNTRVVLSATQTPSGSKVAYCGVLQLFAVPSE